MNVFSDRHHAGLSHSLKLLFEDRLKYNLFFPIGMEWADEKWWLLNKPYNYSLETAKQYLQISPEYKPMDGTVSLNHIVGQTPTHYEIEDLHEGYIQKCITLEQFKKMDIDIIIASIPDHWISFTKLRDQYKPNAKVICQMGNMFVEVRDLIANGTIKNLMSSTSEFPVSCNAVFYHQEFDLNKFYFQEPRPNRKMYSFVNCFNTAQHYTEDWINFLQLEAMMPDWEFRSYGGSCRDGGVSGTMALANKMREANFIYHVKKDGDGNGHVIHNAFAVGRPIITRISDYKDKLAGPLLEDMVTCIDVDKHSPEEIVDILTNLSPIQYEYMVQEVKNRFEKVVNFDEEEKKIRIFLENLK